MSMLHDWYAGLDTSDKEIIKTSLAPTVAILIFLLANVVTGCLSIRTQRRALRHMVIGIFKEISDNLEYGTAFLNNDTIKDAIVEKIRKEDWVCEAKGALPAYRPLIAITESSSFYDAVAASIPAIKSKCLVKVSAYYRSVQDQRMIANTIQGNAFLTISMESRCGVIDDLWTTFSEATHRGQDALQQLNASYPRRWFRKLKP